MKVLSLKQPYAELVISGRKTIELRKWSTKFRGDFLIHASQNPDQEAMKKFNFGKLPLGAIVGKATLIEVKIYPDEESLLKDKDLHLASSGFGLYGFILENAIRLPPVQCKGKLNFWDFQLESKA